MAKFDIPAVRARLTVPLAELRPEMVIQSPEGRGVYMRIVAIGEARPFAFNEIVRNATIEYVGGRGGRADIALHDYRDGYQTRPHAAQLRSGDLIMAKGKRVKVAQVVRDGDRVEVWGSHTRAGKLQATSVSLRLQATSPVKIIEWGS